MSRTKKPCPGCDERPFHMRDANSVCNACKSLIEEGRNFRSRVESDNEIEDVCFPFASYGLPYIHDAYISYENRPDDVFKKAFQNLAIRLSQPSTKTGISKGLTTKPYSTGCDGSVNRTLPKDVADLLRQLYDSATEMVAAGNQNGFNKGHDLLRSIASGDITVNELNALTIQ